MIEPQAVGREASCTVRFQGREAAGKALLETRELVFRGEGLRLKIAFATISSVRVKGGELELRFSDGTAAFALGEREAAAWAARIENPPGRLDKLGVKPGMKVSLVGGAIDPAFVGELRTRQVEVVEGRTRSDCDLIFYAVNAPADLRRLAALRQALRPAGAIWILRVKGAAATVSEAAVMAAGKAAGLVDTKVVAFDERHTAERLVIPIARR